MLRDAALAVLCIPGTLFQAVEKPVVTFPLFSGSPLCCIHVLIHLLLEIYCLNNPDPLNTEEAEVLGVPQVQPVAHPQLCLRQNLSSLDVPRAVRMPEERN